MGLEIKVPVVGESITEVTIAKWLKKDGEQVAMDEVICELESDKATFELPAEAAGILKIRVPEGETIAVGSVLAEISGNGAATAAPAGGGGSPAENQQSGYGGSGQPTSSAPAPEVVSGASAKPQSGGDANGAAEVKEIKIPAVGESITEVTISKWMKKDGDQVAMDEVLCELESDKATFE